MFDLGFSELLIIALVALIVLGPERLPKATRFAGLWVRRARNQWASVKDELERDLASEDLRRSMKEAREAMRETEQSVRASADEARDEFEQMRAAVASGGQAGSGAPAEAPGQAPQDHQGASLAPPPEIAAARRIDATREGLAPDPESHPEPIASPPPGSTAGPDPEDDRRKS